MRVFIILSFLFISALLSANNGNLLFNTFTFQDGLPESQIIKIQQDSLGFIWLGTENGLSRFDGVNFKNYYRQPNNDNSLPNNIINDLFIDSKGTLWISTNYGICNYDPELDRFNRFLPNAMILDNNPQFIINSIGESSEGVIYFLHESGRLYKLLNETLTLELNIMQEGCKFMLMDNDVCWIAANTTIYRFDINTNLTTQYNITFPIELEYREILDIIKSDSILYIGAYKSDLIEYNYITGEYRYFEFTQKLAHTRSLLKHGEELFVGTSEGLHILNLRSEEVNFYNQDLLNEKSLSNNAVNDLFIDMQGNLWVGTADGLNMAQRNSNIAIYSYKYNNIGKKSGVNAIIRDNNNVLWLGSKGFGFDIMKSFNEPLHNYEYLANMVPSPRMGEVFSFFEDSQKNIWISTYLHGVLKYDIKSRKFTQYYPKLNENSIEGADVRVVKEDRYGNIWITVHGKGLSVLEKGSASFRKLSEFKPEIPSIVNQKWVFDMEFDADGNLWLATNNGCMFYDFATNKFMNYTINSGKSKLLSNDVKSIYLSSGKDIWLETSEGINIITSDRSEIKEITTQNGLPDKKVFAINEDKAKNIWISTLKGIVKINEDESGFKLVNYPVQNAIGSNAFLFNATYFDDSLMYFGTNTGYVFFNPSDMIVQTEPNEIVFTEFYLFNKAVEISSADSVIAGTFVLDKSITMKNEIELKEKYNMFGFEFSSLNFDNSNGLVKYSYKLEGFDDEWRDNGSRNKIYFTNLSAGDYILKVKATNESGEWDDKYSQIAIKILPPFWKTRIAMVIYLLVIMAILLYFNHLSVQKQRILLEMDQQGKLRELRTRFFMNVSHELKTPLTLIVVPIKKMIENYKVHNQAPTSNDINMLYRNVNRLMRIMNQIFDFRKIEVGKMDIHVAKGDLIPFTIAILEYFEYQLEQKNIKVKTSFPESATELFFDADKMDKIIFNLLSNAIKHTPENGEIKIEINHVSEVGRKNTNVDYVQWIIRDNGKGIAEDKLKSVFNRFSYNEGLSDNNQGGTGIGLSIVKEFVEMHHGSINIDSKVKTELTDDSFTQVTIQLPTDEKLYNKYELLSENSSILKVVDENKLIIGNGGAEQGEIINKNDELTSIDNDAYSLLIIDDDPEICRILKEEFSINYKVYTSHDGKNGVFKAEKYVPDLIISDVMMPEMDGYEVCKTLKTNLETSHIPIILLTSKSSDEDEDMGYKTGADAFISKPFDMSKLTSRVESLISNRLKLKSTFLSSYGIELKKVLPTETDEKFIQKLIQVVQGNLSDKNLNSEMISREIGISRSQLYKKINSVANTSVNLFIRSIRLKRAAQLLAEGNLNITEVAYEVGFDNLPYFSKCFNEEFGESPSKYAATHRT